MLKKRPLPSYSDGVVGIYTETRAPSSFGAKRNPSVPYDLDVLVRLFFRSDYEVSERLGFTCSAKICTHNIQAVKPGMKAVIGATIYGIAHIDRTNTEMYLYLEGGVPYVDAR